MKTIVFAYHDYGCSGIRALLNSGYEIAAVFTHQDNPAERVFFESVAQLCADRDIPLYAPQSVAHPIWIQRIRELNADYIFSFYYRDLLPTEVLNCAAKGAFNLHGSLLPRYRGRAPLNWVLVNGETETGVTLHHMVAKADAGDIVAQVRVAIADEDTAPTLRGI